jgi:signal transduction histidine kinase/CheY-like chemotaxis protein
MCTFGTYDPENNSYDFLADVADGMEVPMQRVPAAGTPSERFLTDHTSILTLRSDDPAAQGAVPHGTPRRSESVIRSAMHAGPRLLGMIGVHSYTPDYYTQDDVEVIETLAAVAASAIERIYSAREREIAKEHLRRSEEQLAQAQKIEAVGLLAGGIAHDFNNLLTAIKGNSALLEQDEALPVSLREHVVEIGTAADRAAALTRQLLAFSRRQVLQPRVLNLNTLVVHMGNLIRRLIAEDVDLQTVLDDGLWHVRADPHQMEQVILNLALNARDAMTAGGTVVIRTSNVEIGEPIAEMPSIQPGAYIVLSVTDTGVGMSEEARARIFEPFYTTKPVGKGTGLGLSTVYGIVKQSGGHIYAQSKPGAGTTMKMYLPRSLDALDPPLGTAAEPVRPAESEETQGEPEAIAVLVVEDEATVRSLLSRVLLREGYTVMQACTGEEALEIISSGARIDLLLTDTVMPGMNGVLLAERAQSMRPGLAVLHMSGYTEDEVLRRGLSRRGAAFLQKPFSPAVLLKGVAAALGVSRAP